MALKNKFIEKIFGGDEKAFEAKKAANYRELKLAWYNFVADLCDSGAFSATEIRYFDILLATPI